MKSHHHVRKAFHEERSNVQRQLRRSQQGHQRIKRYPLIYSSYHRPEAAKDVQIPV